LYPKDLEQFLKPSELNPTPVTLPPPFPGLARRVLAIVFKKFCQAKSASVPGFHIPMKVIVNVCYCGAKAKKTEPVERHETGHRLSLAVKPSDTVLRLKQRVMLVEPVSFPEQAGAYADTKSIPKVKGQLWVGMAGTLRLQELGLKEGEELHFNVTATIAVFVQQLVDLLEAQARPVPATELGMLYSHKCGGSVKHALTILGCSGTLTDFLANQKQFSVQESGLVSLAVPWHKTSQDLDKELPSPVVETPVTVTAAVVVKSTLGNVVRASVDMKIKDCQTVQSFYDRVAAAELIPFQASKVSLDGQVLEGHHQLSSYIKQGATVEVCVNISKESLRSLRREFLKDNVEHFCMDAGCVMQKQPSNNTTVTTLGGGLNQTYLDPQSEIASGKSIQDAEACLELAIKSATAGIKAWTTTLSAGKLIKMRGKSHTARELKRYIEFFHGSRAEIFNVMEYQGRGGDEKFFEDLNRFFDTSNSSCDPYDFDQTGSSQGTGGFAIILSSDTVASTQSMWSAHTKWHRRWMAQKLESELKAEVCFIQISVDDPKGDKYLADLAAFRGMDLKESQELINHYQDHYVPIQMDGSEDGTPFIHMMNYTKKMVVNKMMRSFVGSSVCHFLSNLHPFEHKIFLARHGESEFNVEMRIGGDSGLSPRGEEFARRAAEFAAWLKVCGEANDLVCVTVTEKDVVSLHEHLVQLCGCLVTCDDWKGFGDSSGAEVNRYMRLKRLQVGWGADFEDAPKNMDDLRRRLNGAKVATLVLVDGDTSSAGQVPGRLWTSSLRRTIDTAKFIEHPVLTGPDGKPYFQMRGQQFRNMDEVYAGEYDGLTEEDIKQKAPNVIEDRKRDKLGFRYPRGESYYDVIARLESVMSHLERIQQPILIISHQAVLRMMYGWLMHINREAAIETQVPQHMIVKITFDGLGGPPVERRYPLGPMEMADDGQANF
ncbi:unnamed protein product, partial [Cladocopium goreaui]